MAHWSDKVLDWFSVKSGAPTGDQIQSAFGELDQAWDYGEANDRELWDSDPQAAHVADAVQDMTNLPQTNLAKLVKLANGGSALAMLYTAHAYLVGTGVNPDKLQAESWYRRAFEAGSLRGLLDYGGLLLGRKEWERAEAVYAVGVEKDWAPAMYWLARTRVQRSRASRTYREVLPLMERAAALGSPRAEFFIAHHMARGRFGWVKIPRGLERLWRFGKRRYPLVEEQVAPTKT